MIPQYDTKLFCEIYNNPEDFLADWKVSGIYEVTKKTISGETVGVVSDDSVRLLFFLLYQKYGNNPIANYDITQFQYKVWATIFQYGPSWEKRLDIQDKLRSLSEDRLLSGTKMIYNHAYNTTADMTNTENELSTINDQNTSNVKKGIVDAYTQLWEMIATDVTSEFLNRFARLFKQFVRPDVSHIYVTEEDEDDE